MIGIDLFAGAGGMTLGAQQAGIKVRLAVESDPNAAATYRTNFPQVELVDRDITGLTEIDIIAGDEPTILFGGPPCQGFSTSNQRTRNQLNPRNWLFREFLRVAALWRPDWIIFENVRGLVETEHGLFLEYVINELAALGYTCLPQVLNAVDFGVPQRRNRLFVIASRHGRTVEVTPPLQQQPTTVQEAIGDLPLLENGANEDILAYGVTPPSEYAQRMRGTLERCSGHLVTRNAAYVVQRYEHIRPGYNWEDIPEHLMENYADRTRCHTGIYHRLQLNQPSVVIGNYRKNMLVHPEQHRGLSVREAARLQSFPDSHCFRGSIGFQQQQVGNAVPPLLARWVFQSFTE